MSDINAFVQQVKGKQPSAVALIVKQAITTPGLYFYGQLFHSEEVQGLAGTPNEPALEVLRLFVYGTLADV